MTRQFDKDDDTGCRPWSVLTVAPNTHDFQGLLGVEEGEG